MLRATLGRTALVAFLGAVLAPACSLGTGSGTVCGTLDALNCWSGPFNLHPDFFAAVPYTSNGVQYGPLQLRIQNGGDYESFSDGLEILIDDAGQIRGDPGADGGTRPSLLGQTMPVSLPPGVVPPGVPIVANPNPPIVHAALYLQKTCRTQNVALYAVDAVSLGSSGTCPPLNGCDIATPDGSVEAGSIDAGGTEGGAPGGSAGSTIVFNSLFDGNPSESDAQKRLTDATFDFYLADPREVGSGGLGPPPPCRGHLAGQFHFYFQRGRPAQPFP